MISMMGEVRLEFFKKIVRSLYKRLCKEEWTKLQNSGLRSFNECINVANAGNYFGYNFKEYFIKENMPERIENLKKGLDSKSIEVVDNKIQHFLNIPLGGTPYYEHCRFDTRDILYTQEELEENNKFIQSLPDLQEKYKGDFDVMVPEVFFYHHGLKFLDQKTINYIQNKKFIDAGAFWGDSCVVLNEYNPSKILSFEMSPSAKRKFLENLELNKIAKNKFEFINSGISNRTFKLKMADDYIMSNLANNSGEFEIEIVKLDDYIKNHNDIGLIKMDIEGAEYEAVLGVESIIRESMPLMLITIYHNPKQFFELKPLIEKISDDGYNFMIRNLNFYRYSELETTLICIPKTI